jgi:hypothetical protein
LRAACWGCQGKISSIPITPSTEHRKKNRVKKWCKSGQLWQEKFLERRCFHASASIERGDEHQEGEGGSAGSPSGRAVEQGSHGGASHNNQTGHERWSAPGIGPIALLQPRGEATEKAESLHSREHPKPSIV